MSQHALTIANQAGAAFRADVVNALQALGSLSSGASAPGTTYAYMLWADSTSGFLKQRNAANSAWVTLFRLSDMAMQDTNFAIVDDGDNTKKAVFQASGITTGTTRTLTVPDQDCEIGSRNVPQNSQSGAYTLVLSDAGKHILHPSADTTARTFTIPANSSVAYPVGTAITFVNQNAAGVLTISITTDTLRLAGAGTTGNRTLAANGIATAIKLTATEWLISGTGLS